jgi:hypothetical protein
MKMTQNKQLNIKAIMTNEVTSYSKGVKKLEPVTDLKPNLSELTRDLTISLFFSLSKNGPSYKAPVAVILDTWEVEFERTEAQGQ